MQRIDIGCVLELVVMHCISFTTDTFTFACGRAKRLGLDKSIRNPKSVQLGDSDQIIF